VEHRPFERPRTRWSWQAHLLTIEFEPCGHLLPDRPPRSFMTAEEISRWVECLYATCPACRPPLADRRAD
jgi:hypothetical protein